MDRGHTTTSPQGHPTMGPIIMNETQHKQMVMVSTEDGIAAEAEAEAESVEETDTEVKITAVAETATETGTAISIIRAVIAATTTAAGEMVHDEMMKVFLRSWS